MSTPKPTDTTDDQKVEPQYLTLADKQPSLIRDAENSSGRTISTRQLSDNLQKTRDGLINLMRNNEENDRLMRYGSDSEMNDQRNESQQDFGMAIRGKKSGSGGNDRQPEELSGSSLNDITNKDGKLGGRGEYGSEEFDANENGEFSNMGKSGSRNAQQRKRRSNTNSTDDFGAGKNFDIENAKLFTSQNPKKDGPLHSRIFIDVFLPSLEGNRIFPLYNYRCADKIERTSKDFYEKNRKRLNKQLLPVSSSDGHCEDTAAKRTRRGKSVELHSVQEIRSGEESREELQKIQELQNVEHRDVEPNQELEDGKKKIVVGEGLENAKQIEELNKVEERQELLELRKEEERQDESLPHPVTATKSDHLASADSNQIEATHNERKGKEAEIVDRKTNQPQVDPLSAEGDELLQKIFRALMANEELIDFFCEKVISKLAERNDFCGPHCKGVCGGLNKPSEQTCCDESNKPSA